MKNLAFGRAGKRFFIFRQFPGNIAQESSNQNQGSCYLGNGIGGPKIIHLSSFLSNNTLSKKNNIPNITSANNVIKSLDSLGIEKLTPINGTANQAAERLINNPANALNQGRYCLRDLLAIN